MSSRIDFSRYTFAPVIDLPPDYEVFDFSKGYDPERTLQSPYGVGKYNEKRPQMYVSELFAGRRDIHVGVDIAAPVGTPIKAFYDGEIFLQGYNAGAGDYGATLITLHRFPECDLYALHGHLSLASLKQRALQEKFAKGAVLGWIGDRQENGGWNPHLHFQLSYVRPTKPDLPGVVAAEDLAQALSDFPDPRLVLGPLYE